MLYQNIVQTMWKNILEMLPHQPRSFDTTEDTGYWTNGSEILCSSELEREIIADFLEDIFSEWGGYKMKTGYYDPFEDAGAESKTIIQDFIILIWRNKL